MSMATTELKYKGRHFYISFGDVVGERYYRFTVGQAVYNKDGEEVRRFKLMDCSQEMYHYTTGLKDYDMEGMKRFIKDFVDEELYTEGY